MRSENGHRLNIGVGLAALGVAITLVVAKALAWRATGSLSVASSLADSALDFVASAANFGAILYAARPADDDHRFGHTAIEDIAGLAQSVLVAGSALLIAYGALWRLIDPQPLREQWQGVAVMVFSAALTGALVIAQRWAAARTGSRAVAADAMHYMSDLWPTLGALAALFASMRWGAHWVDPTAALLAAGLLLRGALRIGKASVDCLMDRELSAEDVARVEAVARAAPGLRGFHDLKTRASGSQRFVQIHIELDGDLTLDEAHARGAALKRAIVQALPGADVIVHKDPYRGDAE